MANSIFVQLPKQLRDHLATHAGMVLSTFDISAALDKETIRNNILFATNGGINPVCTANLVDFGDDIDNCPKNTKELLEVESWECTMSGTALSVTSATIKSLLGAADVSDTAEGIKLIKPRMTIKLEDFQDLWYVVPYGTNGGFIAIKLMNAFNGSLSLQTEDKGKGKWAFTYRGYSTIDDPTVVPMEVYVKESAAEAAAQADLEEGTENEEA